MDGSCHHSVLTGSVGSVRFAEFVDAAPYPPGTTVLLDNHSMHKHSLVRAAAARKGFTLLNTPAYSPEFNPIEMVFGVTKNKFYRRRYSDDFGDDMQQCVEHCLDESAIPSTVSNCFCHVRDFITDGV
ncbi:MAG: transposase [Verrucomicrobiota bacterium]